MTDARKIIRVFLGSPGDLGEERRLAKGITDEFNQLWADELGYQVELVGWEDTVTQFGRPQATINQDLERCELFVGIMWKRWGTPPDHSGPYTSGFEEEFRTSIERRSRHGRPEISLFFKRIEPEFLSDPGVDLQKVLAFKRKLVDEKHLLFEEFADARDFERKLMRCITTFVRKLRHIEAQQEPEPTQAPQPDVTLDVEETRDPPFSAAGTEFLRSFLANTERHGSGESLDSVDIGRFRLLATIVAGHGNDDIALGAHDANLLFAARERIALGSKERLGLLYAGLEHCAHENVPLWHWTASSGRVDATTLAICALFSQSKEQIAGALNALRLIAAPLLLPTDVSRTRAIAKWLAQDQPNSVKNAAIGYLAECGVTNDLPLLRKEYDKNDHQTNTTAADAIIRINLRESRMAALTAIFDLQPLRVSADVIAKVFEEGSVGIDDLKAATVHRSSEVRTAAVKGLTIRKCFSTDIAKSLLADPDLLIRVEALKRLNEAGVALPESEAKAVLVSQHRSGLLGLYAGPDTRGTAALDLYRSWCARQLDTRALELKADSESVLQIDAMFALAERQFARRADELRGMVDDQFKHEFDRLLERSIGGLPGAADLMAKARGLEEHIRQKLTRKGLDVLCQKADPVDRDRVRNASKSGFVNCSQWDFEYLGTVGEWIDVPLIVDLYKRSRPTLSTLLIDEQTSSMAEAAAQAILAVGRDRMHEVLAMAMPSRLLVAILTAAPDRGIRDLSNDAIAALWDSKSEAVRKVTALRCIRALPKRRTSELFDAYMGGDRQRYYNVIHWLDMGVSLGRETAAAAAGRALATLRASR